MTSTPIEGVILPSQAGFGANSQVRPTPMPGRASPAGGRIMKPDPTRKHEEQASAGQNQLLTQSSNLSEEAALVSKSTDREAGVVTSEPYTSEKGRPNDLLTWRTLLDELTDVETSESGVNTFISPSARLLKPSALPLPPRPRNPSSTPVDNTDRKPTENYHGMHPPPNAQAVVSPPQQPCLADYSPWAGEHIEDHMSEQVIKSGYAMKPLVTGETDTAKKAFSSCFRHYSGIQSLSLILASVLKQRHENGKVKASSTFKPPPRVTLTDTKREVWLNDLANPLVPLRRLSRTIPHGIRGKVLLEQCVIKMVPIPRAIWLAKCVGANELRAFRRKGVTGLVMLENEQKWVREWTTVVEAFLDDCSVSSHHDWKNRISYALRLTSQFFAEHLLDREHFLDWSIARLEASDNDTLPLAILKVYMTLSSFTSSLRHARRLASICLAKLHELLKSPDVDLFLPLIDRLKVLLRNLATQHPDCLVIRESWNRYRETFLSLTQDVGQTSGVALDEAERSTTLDEVLDLKRVVDHNDAISRATCKDFPPKDHPDLSLITQLDKLEPWAHVDHVAQHLVQIIPDLPRLVSLVVQWSTSLYRDEWYRIYFAGRLISHYRSLGHDTDEYLLSSWDACTKQTVVCPKKLGRLIAELTRAGDFNATHFLRWLIARGGIVDQNNPCAFQVLVDLPVSSEQPGVAGLQRMILQSNRSSESERSQSSAVKQLLLDEVAEIFRSIQDESPAASKFDLDAMSLSCSDVFEISDFVRQLITLQFESRRTDTSTSMPGDSPSQTMKLTTNALRRIIHIFDLTRDTFALVELIYAALHGADTDSLILICNTFELHFEYISSVGAAEPLCQKLCDRYRLLRKTRPPLKESVLALISACSRLPSFEPFVPRLKQELASCDSSLGIAAHTPMSDIQVESGGNADTEPDPSLVVSPNANSAQIKHALETVLSRASKRTTDDSTCKQLMNVLVNLKTQHESAFQDVTTGWIREHFVLAPVDDFQRDALIFLISSGCLDVDAFTTMVDQICEGSLADKPDAVLTASLKTLNFLFRETTWAKAYLVTRASVALRRYARDHPKALLPFLRRCLDASNLSTTSKLIQNQLEGHSLLVILRKLVLEDTEYVISLFQQRWSASSLEASQASRHLMANLADPSSQLRTRAAPHQSYAPQLTNNTDLATSSDAEAIQSIFETVDGLSLPSHRLFLQFVTLGSPDSEDSHAILAKNCLGAMVDAQSRECPLWRRLATSIEEKVARQVCTLAEKQLLSDSTRQTGNDEDNSQNENVDPRCWSEIVEATAFSLPVEGDVQVGRSIESQLSTAASVMAGNSDLQEEAVQQWLQAICKLALTRLQCFTAAGASGSVVQILCGLLARDVGQWTAQTTRALFDVTAIMIEDLSPQTLSSVKNSLGQLARHPGIRFLFGIAEDTDSWLYATRMPQVPTIQSAQNQEQSSQHPFTLRRWELLPDLAQNPGTNDTALSMKLFDASKVA